MTLQDFFDKFSQTPVLTLYIILLPPLGALLMGLINERSRQHQLAKYIYTSLIYLTCIPGVFVLTLNIYQFLFERQSVLQMNILTHILPVITMIITLVIVRKQISLDVIPGFGKLSGLFMMLGVLMILLWVVDRTTFRVFSFLPFSLAIGIFVILLLLFRLGWSRLQN